MLLGFLLLWVVLLFTSPLSWCCLPSPPVGVLLLSFPLFSWVVLLGFLLLLWVVLLSFPFLWVVVLSHLFGWVVLLGFFLLWMVLMFFFTCLVVLPSFPSLWEVVRFTCLLLGGAAFYGWCCDSLSFGVELPYFRSFGCWLRSPSPLLRGVVFFSLPLVSGAFLTSSVGWCCLVSSSFGRCCFSSLLFCVLLPSCPSSGWDYFLPRLLLGGAAWSTRVVLRCFFFLLRGAAFLPSICVSPWVVLLGFLPLGGVAVSPSPVSWCCLLFPPLGGAAFFHLFCWVVLLGLLLLLGGVALKITKKRCKVKENLKTVAKWKNEE